MNTFPFLQQNNYTKDIPALQICHYCVVVVVVVVFFKKILNN